MTKFFAILLIGLMVGCSSVPAGRITHTRRTREVVLSRQHPQDAFLKARLVAIAEGGTTTIQLIPTGDTLRADLGDYITSSVYGTHGLQLISASAEKHEARLLRTWCETK